MPQGSVLGPFLFLIYANDLSKAANHSTVPMFADDSKCYRQITRPRDRDHLHDDLNSLHQWSKTRDLNFNAKKCVSLRFSRKKTSVPPQDYSLNQQLIKSSSTQSDLGIPVSDNLKWSLHIINIISKANRMLGFLRRNCFHLTNVLARRLCICLLSALTYRSVAKSGFISKEFNIELQSLFFRTMKNYI